jgi:RHS repeat-associated protein
VYFDDLLITHTHSPIVQKDDYYPFGLGIAGLSAQKENSLGNRWTFQGQERQDAHELGWYGFKWRNHQPELGRFFNVDPLSEDYKYNSTFAFSENKVTNSIELEGLESWGWISDFSSFYQQHQLNATIYGGWFNYGVASIWDGIDDNFNMARPMADVMLHSKELSDFELAYENGETYHQFLPTDGPVNLQQLNYQLDLLKLQTNVIGDIGNMAKVQGNWFGVFSGAQQGTLSSSFAKNMAMNRWSMYGAFEELPKDIVGLTEANLTYNGKTVIGHWPNYITKADKLNASFYDIGEAWNPLSHSQRWNANTHFLDIAAQRNDQIYLSVPIKEIRNPSILVDEIWYLRSKYGYQWINQWSLIK